MCIRRLKKRPFLLSETMIAIVDDSVLRHCFNDRLGIVASEMGDKAVELGREGGFSQQFE